MNLQNFFNAIREWFHDRKERSQVIFDFNRCAREAFVSGIAPTLLHAKISKGDPRYKHQFSKWAGSGFRIEIFAGRDLSKDEIKLIGEVILTDSILVRRLIVLGWDTLEVHGQNAAFGLKWQLKDLYATSTILFLKSIQKCQILLTSLTNNWQTQQHIPQIGGCGLQ